MTLLHEEFTSKWLAKSGYFLPKTTCIPTYGNHQSKLILLGPVVLEELENKQTDTLTCFRGLVKSRISINSYLKKKEYNIKARQRAKGILLKFQDYWNRVLKPNVSYRNI